MEYPQSVPMTRCEFNILFYKIVKFQIPLWKNSNLLGAKANKFFISVKNLLNWKYYIKSRLHLSQDGANFIIRLRHAMMLIALCSIVQLFPFNSESFNKRLWTLLSLCTSTFICRSSEMKQSFPSFVFRIFPSWWKTWSYFITKAALYDAREKARGKPDRTRDLPLRKKWHREYGFEASRLVIDRGRG